MLRERFASHPLRSFFPPDGGIQSIEARAFYGPGYQDVQHRRPSIREAQRILAWQPQVPLEQSVNETLDYFLDDVVGCAREASCAVSACE
jgi:UDP-4-amino-4-deoxy-L-arabinose formyltransferase/UDP-glucuronic acid dehydrogenase (UDP-4-keto-hexauronic acid decarboxylating)